MGPINKIHHTLSFRLIFWVGLILLITISVWAYFNIEYQKERSLERVTAEADRLGNTIRLGTHYAMMLYSRNDINQIINNISKQRGIENIRIYNKKGEIQYSNKIQELTHTTNIKAEACYICHKQDPPLEEVGLSERMRIFQSRPDHRLLGVISPIYNEPGCATDPCHIHPEGKKVLGLLDVVVSLKETDAEISSYGEGIIGLAIIMFLGASGIIGFVLLRSVNRPIKKLITGTKHMGQGEYDYDVDIHRDDEIGQLALSIREMGKEIGEKQEQLNKQKEEYQALFEMAPCYITVQDRDFRLLRYNREFADKFDPKPGDHCYKVYKGRSERCDVCPVLRTFEDGKSHFSQESGIHKNGTPSFWVVRTSPIRNAQGEVIAAMEMCLDITQTKRLEQAVKNSEEKYRTIFNTIPNAVFVLDKETLEIVDCNDSVEHVYGFQKEELTNTSFVKLFSEHEQYRYAPALWTANVINRVRQRKKDGTTIFVNIRISPSEYFGKAVLLVTTSDITKRLMAEQQLIQASKMTTLGEMATGVAHELNQPLSVIKTASSFLRKKAAKREVIEDDILATMTEEIDSHVDRASKIIAHMREFGRKSEVSKAKVQVNEALRRALDIFIQQLKLREIEVIEDFQEDLPLVLADANRLEQVFINLLINARDAIEEKWGKGNGEGEAKRIVLKTRSAGGKVIIEVEDTGAGIPKSVLDKIFEPFFTTKNVGKGTGLGLSISYGIIQDYDGSIEAETKEGRGSTFIIRFPVAKEAS